MPFRETMSKLLRPASVCRKRNDKEQYQSFDLRKLLMPRMKTSASFIDSENLTSQIPAI